MLRSSSAESPQRSTRQKGQARRSDAARHFAVPGGAADAAPPSFEGECWTWARTNADGYGVIYIGTKGKPMHVYAYEQLVGRIDPRLELDHLCRNRACFNPKHLQPVTHRVNLMRGKTIAAHNAKKTHCPAGHAYEGENLIVYRHESGKNKGTHRMCRMCKRIRARKAGAA